MTQILSALLPAGMIVLMLSLGLRLPARDVTRALRSPRALLGGIAVQVVGLPLAALALATGFGLVPALTAGLMLVAASPGGVTSNYASLLARGSVGLSVAMTAVTSLAAPLTLPLVLFAAGVAHPGPGGLWKISLGMTAVALAPFIVGMVASRFVPRVSATVSRGLDPVARVVFLAMVLGTFAQNWSAMGAAFADVGAAVTAFAVAAPALAFVTSRSLRLAGDETRTLMIEATMQNVAITIFVATTLMGDAALAIPGLIYAVEMNLVALGVIGFALFNAPRRAAARG